MTEKQSYIVNSFSVKPTDLDALNEIEKLKDHARKTGISFSFFMIKAVKKINKELKLK